MKRLLSIWLLLLPIIAMAQLKYDANWVFGERCGVDFTDPNNPMSFYSTTKNDEPNASISDSAGNLQLYLSYNRTYSWMPAIIRDGEHDTVLNSEGINVHFSATNGAVFLPVPGTEDSIYLFHIGESGQQCDNDRCYRLYVTLLILNTTGKWEVAYKNRQVRSETVEESIALIKKANGIGWWMLTQKQRGNNFHGNQLYLFQIDGPIYFVDSILSNNHVLPFSYLGELVFNQPGDLLLDVVASDNNAFLYRFNRCDGSLSTIDTISFILPNDYIISGVVCEPYIYISAQAYVSGGKGGIFRCKLYGDSISHPTLFHQEIGAGFQMGQLERGPDGNVWVSYRYNGLDGTLRQKYQKHVAIIKNPESDTARFVQNYLFVGDSASVNWAFPNFPNYNLGPEGVFLANAGKDTTLCNNTNSSGVTIGAPPVPNVTYLWQPAVGLSAANIAQPTADPAQSMWYYLTATDTTATSCAVNTDSVYVKVETCTGITETQTLQAKVYPNPTIGTLTIELPNGQSGNLELYNLMGQNVFNASISGIATLQMDLPKGVYIYRIDSGGKTVNGKLLVE